MPLGAARAAMAQSAAAPSDAWQQILDLATAQGAAAVYDISNPTTRTLRDGGGGNFFVTALADGLGNKETLAQATTANQPLHVPGTFGQLDGMLFDGSADRLVTATFAAVLTQPWMQIALARATSLPAGTADADRRFITDKAASGSTNRAGFYWNAPVERFNQFSTLTPAETGGMPRTLLEVVHGATFNGATSLYYGANHPLIQGDSGFNPGTQGLESLSVGTDSAGARAFNGEIGVIVLYNALDVAKLEAMMTLIHDLGQVRNPLPRFTKLYRAHDVGAHQGVATDGNHFYVTADTTNNTLFKYNSSWGLVTSRNCASDNGGVHSQINGVFYNPNDGLLYIGANNYSTSPALGWMYVYNPATLAFVTAYALSGNRWSEGAVLHGGYWWAVNASAHEIRQFDTSFNLVAAHALPDAAPTGTLFWQGIIVLDDEFIINHHSPTEPNRLRAYTWNGSGFTHSHNNYVPPSGATTQSIFQHDKYVYWAERPADQIDEAVVKTFAIAQGEVISTPGGGGTAPPVTIDDFSSAAQGANADPWPSLTHALGASADYLVVMVSHIGTHTYGVTAGGMAMSAGPVAGPADGTNGFVRSFYLLAADLPAPGNISIVVDPNASSARGAVGCWSLSGAAQTALGSLRNDTDLHATGPTTTTSLVSVPAGAAVLGGFVNNTSGTAAAVAGEETEDANFDGVGGTANQVFCSNTPTDTATVTHTFTSPGVAGSYTAALMVEILPGEGGGNGGNGGNGNGAVGNVFAPFYTGYNADEMIPSEIPWDIGVGHAPITHLMHFAAMPQVVGGVSSINLAHFSPALDPAAIITSRNAAGSAAKLLLCVGGANSDTAFIQAIDNNQTQFVDDIVAKVVANGYDGIDIDWEIWGSTVAEVDRFIGFHNALSAALQAENPAYILSSSSFFRFAGGYNTALDRVRDEMLDGLEFAWLQCYAFSAPGFSSQTVWHHSALHTTSDYGTTAFAVAIDETLADYITNHGWPANKIVVGFQYGGRRWTGGSMTQPVAGQGAYFPTQRWVSGGTAPNMTNEETYTEIVALPQYPAELARDVLAGNIPFISHNVATAASDFFLPFDDALSLTTKVDYCNTVTSGGLHVRGYGCWHLRSGWLSGETGAAAKNPLTAAICAAIGE